MNTHKKIIKYLLLTLSLIFLLDGCISPLVVLFQPETYRLSFKNVEKCKTFLRENTCVGMTQERFLETVRSPPKPLATGEKVEIINAGENYYEIGIGGEPSIRAVFENGRYVGYSQWIVEMAGGGWGHPWSDSIGPPCP